MSGLQAFKETPADRLVHVKALPTFSTPSCVFILVLGMVLGPDEVLQDGSVFFD